MSRIPHGAPFAVTVLAGASAFLLAGASACDAFDGDVRPEPGPGPAEDAGIVLDGSAPSDASADVPSAPDTGPGLPACVLAQACLVAFVTPRGMVGAQLGADGGAVAEADAVCRKAASANPGLASRTFRAWLSVVGNSAGSRFFETASLPVVLVTGERVVGSWNDLAELRMEHAVDTGPTGIRLSGGRVWTGTAATGKVDAHCGTWNLTNEVATVGDLTAKDAKWTEAALDTCVLERQLYCFEVLAL